MCFGGSPKVPQVQASPTPSPTPTIMPSEVSSQSSEQTRRNRLSQLRTGIASTIKTGPRGIIGAGAELQQQATGKTFLGA